MIKVRIFSVMMGVIFLISCSAPEGNTRGTAVRKNSVDTCCKKDTLNEDGKTAMQTKITCPKCGYAKMETMPTDVCLIKYNCEKCSAEMRPKDGDCCVFCTYGTHKCPSMQ